VAMGQIPRSTERISSYYYYYAIVHKVHTKFKKNSVSTNCYTYHALRRQCLWQRKLFQEQAKYHAYSLNHE